MTFDIFGKENSKQEKISDYKDYGDIFSQEMLKRKQLKERLFAAKARAFEYATELDTRPDLRLKSNNLLFFR